MNTTLQKIIDRQDISDVLIRYCRAIDRLDENVFRTIFWPDGGYESATGFKVEAGSDSFVKTILDHTMRSLFTVTQHHITNIQVHFETESVAHTECYIFAFHRLDPAYENIARAVGAQRAKAMEAGENKDFDAFVGGRYIDRFEKRNDMWRIKTRHLVIDWTSTALATEWGRDAALAPFAWPGSRSASDPSYEGR